jgi:hypothetical protein
VPALDPGTTLDLDVDVKGSDREVEAVARAVFSDGGDVRIEFEGTPTATGPLVYRLDGAVRGLRPAALGLEATGLLNAEFRANLYGPSLDRLDGRLNARVYDSSFEDYAPGPSLAEATFEDGEAEFSLETSLYEAGLTLAGTTRPFDEDPSYTIRGALRHLDIGRFTEDPSQQSDLNTTFTLTGHGVDLQTADLRFTFALSPSTLNTVRISEGQIQTALEDGRLDFDAALALAQGRIAVAGVLHMDDTPRYSLRRGVIEQVPLAALMGDTTASVLNGTFTLEGRARSASSRPRIAVR